MSGVNRGEMGRSSVIVKSSEEESWFGVYIVRKNLNAAKPPEKSESLGGNIGCTDKNSCCCLKKNLNAPRPSEHLPVRGKNVKTFRWDQ